MKKFGKFALLTVFMLHTLNTYALGLGLEMGFSSGGDTLVSYSNASDFQAGDGLNFSLLLTQSISDSMELRASYGYKFKSDDFVNAGSSSSNINTLTSSSQPATLGLMMKLGDQFGVEVGALSQLNGKLKYENSSGTSSIDFPSNVAKYFELSYRIRKAEYAVRYANGLVLTSSATNVPFNANYLAFMMRSFF